MEEDPAGGDNIKIETTLPINKDNDENNDNVKRLKTSDSGLGKSEESSSSSSNHTEHINEQDQEMLASTSTGTKMNSYSFGNSVCKFKPLRKSGFAITRNYRNNREQADTDTDNVESMDHENENTEETETTTQTADVSVFADTPEYYDDADDDDDDFNELNEDSDEDEDEEEEEHGESTVYDRPINFRSFTTDEDSMSTSTVMHDTDNEADDEDHFLFKKEKAKHTWFVVNDISKRQYGSSAKLQSRDIFQRRCYGSLYAVRRLELMYKLEEHSGCVNSLNFHPDGTLLASGSDDLKIVIWDWKLGKCLMKYKTHHRGNVFQSKFLHLSGDLFIASCARDGQVRLTQLSREGSVRNNRILGTHRGPCHKLIVLPEQPQVILSAGEDGVVLSHDARGPKSTKVTTVEEDRREVALYSIHGHPLKSNEFIVCGRDTIVRVYDQRKANKPAAIFTPFPLTNNRKRRTSFHVTCAVYNYNGSEILASYSNSDIYLFDGNNYTETGNVLHHYQGHKNQATIKGVNFFGPKSEFIVSGSDCGHIYFWERNTESLAQWLLADDNGVVNCIEPHPQLPFICSSGLDWDIKVWVPSNEDEPNMNGLVKVLRRNGRGITDIAAGDMHESQMLWMLWRHLRNSNRVRHDTVLVPDSNSSASDSMSSPDSDEEFDGSQNCLTT